VLILMRVGLVLFFSSENSGNTYIIKKSQIIINETIQNPTPGGVSNP
jgi:hypothetical protein